MNIHTSITGTSGQADRLASGNKSTEPTITNMQGTAAQTSINLSAITNIGELKQRELRGEHYTVSDEQIVKAIERAIKAAEGKTTSLEFNVHEKTKMIAVKVLDRDSGQVIREIPPEKTLDFVAKLWEMAGILIDEKI
ncbi:flagellar protein FlaG [Paenibacillus sp. sgz302251]|uniref:flagellar protein FlaG n=1 Tax=Paenibacillus sp. sgz302251 TaxID=3414493 RepID=UPI003C7A4C0F